MAEQKLCQWELTAAAVAVVVPASGACSIFYTHQNGVSKDWAISELIEYLP